MGNWGEITTISGVMGPYSGRSPPCRHRDVFLQGPNMETDLQYMYQTGNWFPQKRSWKAQYLCYICPFWERFPYSPLSLPRKAGDGDLFVLHIFSHLQLCYFQFSKYLSWRKALFKDTVDGSPKKCTQEWTKPGKWWDKLSTSTELNRMNHNSGYEFKNLLAAQ